MAGSYRHMTKADGTPYDEAYGFDSMLENGGDVVEALRKCYGMIWYMAELLAEEDSIGAPSREQVMLHIDEAQENARQGRARGESGN